MTGNGLCSSYSSICKNKSTLGKQKCPLGDYSGESRPVFRNPPGMSIFSAGSSQPNFASKKDDTNRKNGIDAIVGKSMER
jgi:hypothetical protein